MKQLYLSIFLLTTLALCSCRKDGVDIDIKTYDQQQIEAYIKANGLNNMKRDVSSGDTTGIYYEILSKGTSTKQLDYSDKVLWLSSFKSFDGLYNVTDTLSSTTSDGLYQIRNYSYVGNLAPNGLMLAVLNIVKTKGTRVHLLIPSRLAYGRNGLGTGSSRLRGNQCLDMYVNVLDESAMMAYDEFSIRKYAQSKGIDISTYSRTPSGAFYKITKAGTGTVYPSPTGTVTIQNTGTLLNDTQFDISGNESSTGVSFNVSEVIKGYGEALQKGTANSQMSVFIPSTLAYGLSSRSGIPAFSTLRFEINLLTVTN